MRVRVIASLVMALCLTAGMASAQTPSIGVYFDPQGCTCEGIINSFTQGTWYILACLTGPVSDGITGAEFRLDGVPAGWFVTATPNPAANVIIGSPHSGVPQGVNIAFPACQPPTPGCCNYVLLFTYSAFATTQVVDNYLIVRQHQNPANPAFQCPALFACDIPVYTEYCAYGGAGIINRSLGHDPCRIAVQRSSWSQVKGLYN